jgi:hypothetical protein
MSMDIKLETDKFVTEVDQYRAGLLVALPQIDYTYLSAIGSFYHEAADDPGVLEPEAPAAIRKLLLAIAPADVPWGAPFGLILVAVSNHQCLQICVGDEVDAYAFAAALIAYVETHTSKVMTNLVVEPHVCRLLNAWLRPAVKWRSLPSVDTVCRHMFGDSWCDIVLPAGAKARPGTAPLDNKLVANLISLDRPPFRLGLCHNGITVSAIGLPVDLAML